ncbi:MAG: peptidylprolyl isomerase [Burkholderiales bacterium]|nr:peptidylprolyl isomerase [Burkholderiales bacterium]
MIRTLTLLALTAGAAALAVPVQAQNVARVNGVAIPSARVDAMVKELVAQGRGDNPQLRQMIKDELINREIMMQEAMRMGLSRSPEVASQLEFARQNVLVRAYLQDYLRKHPVSDADIQGEYDRIRKEMGGEREFRARHILVKTEELARAIIGKLKGGARFEDLAKQSDDPGSRERGGDLDWATAGTFVPEFGRAMAGLKKGETTETPVRTQFGFHVIRLDDVRESQFPSLEQARPQISQQLQRQRMDKMMGELRGKARVE